jgi:hypothetical protein
MRSKGNVTQAARSKFGAKSGSKGMRPGSFPVFDRKSARSALKLRGHAPDPGSVISKVLSWANKNNDTAVAMAAKLARKKDAKK